MLRSSVESIKGSSPEDSAFAGDIDNPAFDLFD